GEQPGVGRIPAGVNRREPDRTVVGVVDRPVVAPGEVEAHRDHHVGPVPPDRRGDVAAQRHAVLDEPVAVAEAVHVEHPDHAGAAPLLLLAQRPDHVGGHALDARLAGRGDYVRHMAALPGPPGDRGGASVFQVIGMRDHYHGAVPVLRHRIHRASMIAGLPAGRGAPDGGPGLSVPRPRTAARRGPGQSRTACSPGPGNTCGATGRKAMAKADVVAGLGDTGGGCRTSAPRRSGPGWAPSRALRCPACAELYPSLIAPAIMKGERRGT